jgi:hypothetical protein
MTPCALSVGFLLPRPCENAAVGNCAKCARATCEAHATLSGAGLLCRACETGSELPLALAGLAVAAGLTPVFAMQDLATFEAAGIDDEGPEDKFADLS